MFNRCGLGSMAVLVLLSIGCSIPTSKHPLVNPSEATSYPELYGAYRKVPPSGQEREPYLYHVGEAGEGYPPGFVRIISVGWEEAGLGARNMFTFVEKMGDAYILHLPAKSGDEGEARKATFWKPWNESWQPAKDGWDGKASDAYFLLCISIRGEKLYMETMDSEFLVTEIEAGRLTGKVTWPEEEKKNPQPTSVHITAETPELRAFFERHAAGGLFLRAEDAGHYVRLKSGQD